MSKTYKAPIKFFKDNTEEEIEAEEIDEKEAAKDGRTYL